MSGVRATALALLTLHAVALAAQDQPQFRASTRLVQVSVVVEGRDRRPIGGLTVNDFRLYDGGQEQRIELFLTESVSGSTETPDAAPSVPSTPVPAVQDFSNRIASRGSATVILFDRLNTLAADQVYVRQHLFTFLQQIRREDRVGIYVLEPDAIRVLHDFTNDARSLVRAMSRYRAVTSNEALETTPPEPADTGNAALDAQLAALFDRASASMTQHFTALRSDATITAFQAIANHLAAIDGRKNLIWITAGFPLEALTLRGGNMSTEIQRAIRPLNDANVTLYAVDARGLIAAMRYDTKGAPAFTSIASVQTNLDVLQIAAAETGGRAFFNSNDINAAVRRAVDDSQVTYTLGYYPAHGSWTGAYRPIKVQVNRPRVQVRHRKGYLAAPGPERVTASMAIRSALLSPLEATGLDLTARIERVPGTASEVKVAVTTGPGAVVLQPAGEQWEGTLDVVIAQKLSDGSAPKSVDRTLTLSLRRDRYDEARTRGFTIDMPVTLLPGVQSLHIIVHDVSAGTTGSIVVPADKLQR